MQMRDFLGFTYAAPLYGFGDKPGLIEAAERIRRMGSKTIKLFLVPGYKIFYGHNTRWPDCKTLMEMASADPMKRVLDMDFTTIVLESFPIGEAAQGGSFVKGFTRAQLRAAYEEIFDLSEWLLDQYKGSGKTFIIQNWESDWAVRGESRDATVDPELSAIDNLVVWCNNRQEAVDYARQEALAQGVNVWHCLEVNLVKRGMEGHVSVTTHALSRTRCDLYSYSAYDTSIDGADYAAALDFLLKHCPPSATVGDKNLMVGEFGIPENEFSQQQIKDCIENTVEQARIRGLRHCIYWEWYCNEASDKDPSGCRGFWVFRRDGSEAYCHHIFRALLDS